MSNSTFRITNGESRAAETNLIKNTVFGAASWDDGWVTYGTAPYVSLTKEPDDVKFGDSAARIVFTGTGYWAYELYTGSTRTAFEDQAIALYAWVKTTLTDVRLEFTSNFYSAVGTTESSYHSGSGEWELLVVRCTPTFDVGGETTRIYARIVGDTVGGVAVVGSLDLVVSPSARLQHIDGLQAHCGWNGTPHESTSYITAFTGKSFEFANVDYRTYGFFLDGISPAVAQYSGGGFYNDKSFSDGRTLISTRYDWPIETLGLKAVMSSQDGLAELVQDLRRLLVQARDYWVNGYNTAPVWIEARSSKETNKRYAIIHNAQILEDGDMWRAPFLQTNGAAVFDHLSLVIERGHWSNERPKEKTPVPIAVRMIADQAGDDVFVPLESFDDVQLADGAFTLANDTHLRVGCYGTQNVNYYDSAVRFRNVTIPQGASIISAVLTFVPSITSGDTTLITIKGEDEDTSEIYSTGANLHHRLLGTDPPNFNGPTTAYIDWSATGTWTAGTPVDSPDISTVIQEIVNRPGWASGNDLSVFLYDNDSLGGYLRYIASFDHASYAAPSLAVTFSPSAEAPYGNVDSSGALEPIAGSGVFISNLNLENNITHIFHYDSNITTYSANLVNASVPFDILPDTAAVGDILYIGIQSGVPHPSSFKNVIFDIGTPAVWDGGVPIWEHYTGGWATLTTVVDHTADVGAFSVAGPNSVAWDVSLASGLVTINGVEGYFVRLRVPTGVTTVQTPTQINRTIYTANKSYVEIQSDEIGGDINADLVIEIKQQGDNNGPAIGLPDFYTDRFMLSFRDSARGENFTPYINIGALNNPDGIAVTAPGFGTLSAFPRWGYGTADENGSIVSSSNISIAEQFRVTISPPLSGEYNGKFRIFGRYHDSGFLSAVGITTYLKVTTGSGGSAIGEGTTITKSSSVALSGPYIVDYGVFNIDMLNYVADSVILSVYVGAEAYSSFFLSDLILMPVDQLALDVRDAAHTDNSRVSGSRSLVIDNISSKRLVAYVSDRGEIVSPYTTIHNGVVQVESNKKVRMFMFAMLYYNGKYVPEFGMLHSVKMYSSQKYLSMRGSR